MNGLDSRLEDELRSIARALVAEAPEPASFRSGVTRTQKRRGPFLAAATIAVLGAVGVVTVARRSSDDRESPGTAIESGTPGDGLVTMPDLYPVIDGLPESGFAHVSENDRDLLGGQAPQAAAIIGKVSDDGAMISTLTVAAGLEFAYRGESTDVATVFGATAAVYDESETGGPAGRRTVAWGVPPDFVSDAGLPFLAVIGQPASAGADPIDLLAAADPLFATFDASEANGPVELAVGQLPAGYELVVGPEPIERRPWTAMLRTSAFGPFVETSTHFPLYGYVGPLEPTTVRGVDGWIAEEGRSVVWPVGDSTWARVLVDPGNDPVEFAESVRFVDWDTWNGLYDATTGYPDADFVPITGPFEYPQPEFSCDGCVPLSSAQQDALDEYLASLPNGTT